MASDLVERLAGHPKDRDGNTDILGCLLLMSDAADTIEANAARIAALEAELADARAERDNSRANSVSRGKKLLRLRAKLVQISDSIEHEGDRAYFGSTNDADELREIFLWLDGFKWDRVTSESDEDDLLSAVERLLARATAAEARAEKMAEALIFYADPANWIDTPPWDGDPETITEKAVPVDRSQGGSPCDCGDKARAALRALAEAKP